MTLPIRIPATTDLSAPSRHAMNQTFRLTAETNAQLTVFRGDVLVA